MLVLVTYDVSLTGISGQKRLRKVAKICQNYGVRVQNSVFECVVDQTQYVFLKERLRKEINEKEVASVFTDSETITRKRLNITVSKPPYRLRNH